MEATLIFCRTPLDSACGLFRVPLGGAPWQPVSSASCDVWPLQVQTKPTCFVAGVDWACTACLPGSLCVHCEPFQSLGPCSAGCPDQVFTEEGPKVGGEKVENNCGLPDVSPWVFPARQRPAQCSRPTQKLPSLSDDI